MVLGVTAHTIFSVYHSFVPTQNYIAAISNFSDFIFSYLLRINGQYWM